MTGEVAGDMLRHNFIHVPGIGYITEQKLWAQGLLSWDDYLDRSGQEPKKGMKALKLRWVPLKWPTYSPP
jgi:hypothetical protein